MRRAPLGAPARGGGGVCSTRVCGVRACGEPAVGATAAGRGVGVKPGGCCCFRLPVLLLSLLRFPSLRRGAPQASGHLQCAPTGALSNGGTHPRPVPAKRRQRLSGGSRRSGGAPSLSASFRKKAGGGAWPRVRRCAAEAGRKLRTGRWPWSVTQKQDARSGSELLVAGHCGYNTLIVRNKIAGHNIVSKMICVSVCGRHTDVCVRPRWSRCGHVQAERKLEKTTTRTAVAINRNPKQDKRRETEQARRPTQPSERANRLDNVHHQQKCVAAQTNSRR